MYDTQKEMDQVIGKFSENTFIQSQQEEMDRFLQEASLFSAWLKSK
jgi:succinate dehydrogenase flavin-adding protein (antitoxin of CptAB toxin-antitoxin module)